MRVLLLTFIVLSAISCNTATKPEAKQPTVADTIAEQIKAYVPVHVTILPTDGAGGMSDSEVKAFKYADVGVASMGEFADQLAAYGAAYQVWIGPKGWTGKGSIGADGNVLVHLYPPGGADLRGAYAAYYEVPACAGCMLSAAARYFPRAMNAYNAAYNKDKSSPVSVPKDIHIKRLSSTLITYTYPLKDGLIKAGVAFYTPSTRKEEMHYAEATISLPPEQQKLSDFLIKFYVRQISN